MNSVQSCPSNQYRYWYFFFFLCLVTTPAYMFDGDFHEIHDGVAKMVEAALAMIWILNFNPLFKQWQWMKCNSIFWFKNSYRSYIHIMSFTHFLVISAFFGTFCIVFGDRYIGDMCSACLAVAYQFDQAFVKVKISYLRLYFASRTILSNHNISECINGIFL